MDGLDATALRGPLRAAGVLLLAALAGTAAVRLSGVTIREPDAPASIQRSLHFVDRADGGIDVVDARSGRAVGLVQGQAGFVRGTLRALVRERRRAGLDASTPFDLIGRADGRLTLQDTATGQRVDLESFGPTNAAVFAVWLQEGPP